MTDLTIDNVGQAVIRGLIRLREQSQTNPDYQGPPALLSDNYGRRVMGLNDVRFQVNLDKDTIQVIIEGANPGERPDLVAAIGGSIIEESPDANVLVGTEPYKGHQKDGVETHYMPSSQVASFPILDAIRAGSELPEQRQYSTSV